MSMYNEDTQFNAMNKHIAQLEAQLADVRRLVTVASGCWCSIQMCDEEEHRAMEELIAWTEGE